MDLFTRIKLLYKSCRLRRRYQNLMLTKRQGYEMTLYNQIITQKGHTDRCCDGCYDCWDAVTTPFIYSWWLMTCGCLAHISAPKSEAIKSILGFTIGMAISWGFFAISNYVIQAPVTFTAPSTIVLVVLLGFGLAFTSYMRLMSIIAIPTLCSSTGRFLIITFVLMLMFKGPVLNTTYNTYQLGKSMACGEGEVKQKTKEIWNEKVTAPIKKAVKRVNEAVKKFARTISEKTKLIQEGMKKIAQGAVAMVKFFQKMEFQCKQNLQRIVEQCDKQRLKMVAKFVGDKDTNIITQAIDTLFGLVICNFKESFVAGLNNACDFPGPYYRRYQKMIKDEFMEHYDAMKEDLYVDTDIETVVFSYNLNKTKSYRQILREVKDDVRHLFGWLNWMIIGINISFPLFSIVIIFRSHLYRWKYLSRDHYDNVYLNQHLIDLDMVRAKKQNLETVFPLVSNERSKYIDSWSLRLSTAEKRKFLVSFTFFFTTVVIVVLHIAMDYSLYWSIGITHQVKEAVNITIVPPKVTRHIEGRGALSDMYREAGDGALEPIEEANRNLSQNDMIEQCWPRPREPDYAIYRQIRNLLLLAFVTVIIEAYTLRLRHYVCNKWYPDRAKERAIWLYNDIIQSRGSFLRYLNKQAYAAIGFRNIEKVSLLERLSTIPIIRLIRRVCCGWRVKYCTTCGRRGDPEDYDGFKHCKTTIGCRGVFCNKCVVDNENVCSECQKEIVITDDSDVSEELDSSDEDDDYYDERWNPDDEYYHLIGTRNKMKKLAKIYSNQDLSYDEMARVNLKGDGQDKGRGGEKSPSEISGGSDDETRTRGAMSQIQRELGIHRNQIIKMTGKAKEILKRSK